MTRLRGLPVYLGRAKVSLASIAEAIPSPTLI